MMMTTTTYAVRSVLAQLNPIFWSSTKAPLAFKSIQTRCLVQQAQHVTHQTRSVKKAVKRIVGHNHHKQPESANDGNWSVIAYTLSEELRIENAQKLLESFSEYHINDISVDLQEEAVMLSLKEGRRVVESGKAKEDFDSESTLQPLHDIFLFREGSIVFWGVPYEQQKRILYGLSPLKIDPYANELIQEEKEHINYELVENSTEKTRLNRDVIQISLNQDLSLLQLNQFTVSHAIATSVKLAIWEAKLDQYIESVGWVTQCMKQGKRVRLTRDQVFRKTGEIYELKHCINLSSDLLDLPDIYWDRAEQETLFMSLMSFLNVKKRTTVINEKLNNCCELMNLLATHMNDKHHVRLEWMIIMLIMVEVLFEFSRFF